MSRFIGLNEVPDADKPLLVAPRLKQDDMGICVYPSKYDEGTSSTLSARDRRRIVSVVNALLLFVYLFRFTVFCIFLRKATNCGMMNI